jgi:hypothetical protein
MGQPESRSTPRRTRRDGWTAERQLKFLAQLSRTRSVTRAVASIGMSREGAYRLRARAELFAALWDRALTPALGRESHNRQFTNGQLMRLLGNHYRRQSNGFWPKCSAGRTTS